MEASGAGLAGGQAAQGDGGQAAEGEAQQTQQAPDVGALAEQLGTMAQGQEELREFLMSAPWQQQAEAQATQQGEPELPELDLSPFGIEQGESQEIAKAVSALAEQQAQQMLQQHLQPLQERQERFERQQQAKELTAEFPELAEVENAREVVKISRDYAQALGQPELADNPLFWRLIYTSGRAFEAAKGEGEEAPAAAHLEGGGGAAPSGGQPDMASQIVNAKRGASVLPFRAEIPVWGERYHSWGQF